MASTCSSEPSSMAGPSLPPLLAGFPAAALTARSRSDLLRKMGMCVLLAPLMVSPSAANTGTPAKRSSGLPCSLARVRAACTSSGSGTSRKAMSVVSGSEPEDSSSTLSS
eukprot:1193873-Prorocentrum_minimum.AAC.1